jgi:hypothetical protein
MSQDRSKAGRSGCLRLSQAVSPSPPPSSLSTPTMITHIVLIKWNSTATAADRSSVDAMIISMKDLCQTGEGEPYITDIISGPQNNTEGLSDAHVRPLVSLSSIKLNSVRPLTVRLRRNLCKCHRPRLLRQRGSISQSSQGEARTIGRKG